MSTAGSRVCEAGARFGRQPVTFVYTLASITLQQSKPQSLYVAARGCRHEFWSLRCCSSGSQIFASSKSILRLQIPIRWLSKAIFVLSKSGFALSKTIIRQEICFAVTTIVFDNVKIDLDSAGIGLHISIEPA